ncbi:hypothetical protein [Ramlibacter sp.]|uniref:hypothetical protein n=1 Tax=Ramlibacter sp. TaxID=1917967 RepID=UPI002C1DDF4A|nr:hypothetical protein [Ramlibacter sp.]HWI84455.1 hypothetical protein [Ramlibacter sp.]
MKFSSVSAKAAAVAALALAAAGSATVAQARDNVYFSIGANVAPGVAVGVSNAPPVYYPPVTYVQPAPVYYEPAPVYVRPAPVYYARPVYGYSYAAPVYYGGPRHHRHGGHGRHEGWR